jgi:hypothetical protein
MDPKTMQRYVRLLVTKLLRFNKEFSGFAQQDASSKYEQIVSLQQWMQESVVLKQGLPKEFASIHKMYTYVYDQLPRYIQVLQTQDEDLIKKEEEQLLTDLQHQLKRSSINNKLAKHIQQTVTSVSTKQRLPRIKQLILIMVVTVVATIGSVSSLSAQQVQERVDEHIAYTLNDVLPSNTDSVSIAQNHVHKLSENEIVVSPKLLQILNYLHNTREGLDKDMSSIQAATLSSLNVISAGGSDKPGKYFFQFFKETPEIQEAVFAELKDLPETYIAYNVEYIHAPNFAQVQIHERGHVRWNTLSDASNYGLSPTQNSLHSMFYDLTRKTITWVQENNISLSDEVNSALANGQRSSKEALCYTLDDTLTSFTLEDGRTWMQTLQEDYSQSYQVFKKHFSNLNPDIFK